MAFPLTIANRTGPAVASSPAPRSLSRPAAEAQRQADHLLIARFAPPGVLVNERLEVVQFRGRTGEFLEQPPGQPQTNLLKMARGDLLVDLQRAISEAKERGTAARADGVQVVRGNQTLTISLEVLPLLGDRQTSERYFLVTFHDSKGAAPRPPESTGGDPVSEAPRLREELAATKQYLEALIDQHQTSGDELATLNEELTAANEELQSTNEELESAKEELQSANEELTTLNDELRSRNSDLDQLANDLSNVLEAVEIPIVIVDAERQDPALHPRRPAAPRPRPFRPRPADRRDQAEHRRPRPGPPDRGRDAAGEAGRVGGAERARALVPDADPALHGHGARARRRPPLLRRHRRAQADAAGRAERARLRAGHRRERPGAAARRGRPPPRGVLEPRLRAGARRWSARGRRGRTVRALPVARGTSSRCAAPSSDVLAGGARRLLSRSSATSRSWGSGRSPSRCGV